MSIFQKHVFVCTQGKSCSADGSEAVLDALREEVQEQGLKDKIRINKSGCLNQCGNGPMAVVYPEGVWYAQLSPRDSKEIVRQHLIGNKPVARCLYKNYSQ